MSEQRAECDPNPRTPYSPGHRFPTRVVGGEEAGDRGLVGGEIRRTGCFIATAVYQSPMAPEVVSLRKFRDETLTKSWLGKKFVAVYYKVSPPIADWLKKQPKTSSVVRSILNQIVRRIS